MSFTYYVAERSWKGKTHAFLIYLYIWKSQEFISREFRAAFKKILCKFFCQTKWNHHQWKVFPPSTAPLRKKLTQKSGVTMSHCVTLWHGWRLPKILVHWSKPTPWTLVCHMKEIEKTQSFIFAKSAKFAFLHFFIFAFMHLHLVCRFASLPNVHFAKEARKDSKVS